MSNQSVLLKNQGLQNYPNQLNYSNNGFTEASTPLGSLDQADDVVISRDNVIEPRRGFTFYGTPLGTSSSLDIAKQLLTYKTRILSHFASTMCFDSDGVGTFVNFSTSVSQVQSGLRIKYAESNGNLYFTTNKGIQKISIASATGYSANNIVPAGMPEGLDITLSLNSQQGFFQQESAVAYRALWGVTDANNNEILGSPSNRQIIYNPLTPLLGNDFNNLLTALDTVNQPNGIKAQDYYSTYHVPASTSNSSLLRSNLISLAEALDVDIASSSAGTQYLIATGLFDQTGSISANQITLVSGAGIFAGQEVTFDTAVTAATGITGTTSTSSNQITSASGGGLSGVAQGQTVTSTISGLIPENTIVTGVSSTTITINSIPTVSGTFSGVFTFTNPNPFQDNTLVQSVSGNVVTLNQSATSNGNYVGCINFNSTYVNIAGTNVIPANTPPASTPTVSSSTTGVTYNITTILTSAPSILQLGDPVTIAGITPSTFDQTGIVQAISGNAITINVQIDPGTYISQSSATLERTKYSYLTQPLTLDDDPFTNELVSMQVYYQSILTILQNEPTIIVGSLNPFTGLVTTGSATVNIYFPIPAGITTQDFFQIYRTLPIFGSVGVSLDSLDPGDEEFLAYEGNPTSQDITNGYLQVQDIQPDSFLGASLYTDANTGTGITSANVPPPLAKDITLYYNYMFYANTVAFHSLNTTLLGVGNFVSGTSTLTISNGTTTNTYTFSSAGEDPATKTILISSANTPSLQIQETAKSIVNVINRNAGDVVYAFYESGATDLPGKILLQARNYGDTAFTLTVDSTNTGAEFNPAIPTSGSTTNNTSQNDARPNRVFYSTQFEPDSVPIVNFIDIGPQDEQILRILALRQSLFIFKQEGIYRITGNTAASFQVSLFDSSTYLTAPDSAAILNNTIYCITNQGIVNVSDSGVKIISRPIEGSIIKFNDSMFVDFNTATFGVGYESDRTYNLWTVSLTADVLSTQSFRYNTITEAWTRCTKTANCAVVNPTDDKLYIGATDQNVIEQERKNFDRTDYADRQYTLTIGANSVSGTTVTLNTVENVTVGDVLVQTQYLTIKQFNRLLTKLDSDFGLKNKNYTSFFTVVAGVQLLDSLLSLATALDSDAGTHTKTYLSSITGFNDTFVQVQEAFNTIITLLNADTGTQYKNYVESTGTVPYEINITAVNTKQNQVTTAYGYPFIQGPIIAYNHITSIVQWLPSTMGDPSMSKHVSEATVIFEKLSFTDMTVSFSSDIVPGLQTQDFPEVGNGSFGNSVYGNTVYGDSGNAAPLRTYIPRDMQRCRFLNVQFTHAVARELFSNFGVSLTYTQISQRAWK